MTREEGLLDRLRRDPSPGPRLVYADHLLETGRDDEARALRAALDVPTDRLDVAAEVEADRAGHALTERWRELPEPGRMATLVELDGGFVDRVSVRLSEPDGGDPAAWRAYLRGVAERAPLLRRLELRGSGFGPGMLAALDELPRLDVLFLDPGAMERVEAAEFGSFSLPRHLLPEFPSDRAIGGSRPLLETLASVEGWFELEGLGIRAVDDPEGATGWIDRSVQVGALRARRPSILGYRRASTPRHLDTSTPRHRVTASPRHRVTASPRHRVTHHRHREHHTTHRHEIP